MGTPWAKESKLELAASMVRHVMPVFRAEKNVIILCDSWYVKKDLISIVDEYENLDLIGNARSDSVIYDLPRSGQIRQQVFYAIFVKNIETSIKSNAIMNALKQLIQQQGYHL